MTISQQFLKLTIVCQIGFAMLILKSFDEIDDVSNKITNLHTSKNNNSSLYLLLQQHSPQESIKRHTKEPGI